MKNNISKNNIDSIDNMLFNLAKNDYTPIPEDIHNSIINTIESLSSNIDAPKSSEVRSKFKATKKSMNKKFTNIFKGSGSTIITRPSRLIAITFLLIILIGTGVVGARNMSEKFFNKDTVRLNGIGIANEFIFTEEIESALKQNVPLNLVQLDENYYISIHSILLDEFNFFTVFELHSRSGVTDDLRFIIRDLKVTDENKNLLYCSNIETNNNKNIGYNHIYNKENSIKELFFMFGNDSSKIKELNFTFSNIEIYKYSEDMTKNPNFKDIHLTFEGKTINITITKDNYNTINEYVLANENNKETYDIQKIIYTKTGLYILTECNLDEKAPIINVNNQNHVPIYNLPLKRFGKNKTLMLYSYNIKNINNNTITLYSERDKEKYNLIPKN